ncbi:MAG TPA: hypothetical protein VIY47_02690, partial [Ignavibacteriaceae bacterium]
LLEDKINILNVQIGDRVLLQSKLEGTYLGIASLYGALMVNPYSKIGPGDKDIYTVNKFLRRQIVEYDKGKYYISPDVKILAVIQKAEIALTQEEAIARINIEVESGFAHFTSYPNPTQKYFWLKDDVRLVALPAIQNVKLSFEEIPYIDAIRVFNDMQGKNDSGALLLQDTDGKFHIISFPYLHSAQTMQNLHILDVDPIRIDDVNTYLAVERPLGSLTYLQTPHTGERLDNFEKFYKIVKHIKKQTYV